MAGTSGAAGYQQLTKVGNYISDNNNRAADRSAANMRHQSSINDAKQARAEKRLDKALEGTKVDIEALQAKATGFETRDDLARDYAMTATKRSEEYAEKAREAAAAGDWVAMNNWKGKMNRIKGDFKNTVNDEAILAENMKVHQEKYFNGEVDDDEWLDFGEAIEDFNYEIVLDENDNKVIRAIVMDDKGNVELDEDGNAKIIEKKWSEVVNQKDRPYEVVRLEDKEGKKGLIGDLLSTMGKRKYDQNTGQYITTSQTWDDEAENQFKAKVRGLQSNDRVMYSLLRQASGGQTRKKSNFTDQDKALVEDFLRFQVKGGYDTTESKKVRGRTPEEMEREAARNRAVTRRGQDLSQDRANKSDKNAKARLELDWWRAKNHKKSGSKPTKKELKKSNSALAYEIAIKIKNAGKDGDKESTIDAAISEIGEEYGLNISKNSDWWGRNEFNLDDKEYYQDDPHGVAKAIAKKMGYEYDAGYAQEQLTKKLMDDKKKKKKPTAADLINKYSNK